MSTSASSQRPGSPGGASGRSGAGPRAAARSSRPAQRPAAGKEGLVRSVPKAKVRRARLLVSRIDPWSAVKLGFLLAVALGIIMVVGVICLWMLMDLTGIFGRLNDVLGLVLGAESGDFTVETLAPLGTVISLATIVAVVNTIVLTLLSAVLAIIYNMSSALVGGVGVTLTDD